MGNRRVKNSGSQFWTIVRNVCDWMFRLRAVLLSLPVIIAAIVLAVTNISRLPDKVGLDMLATGDFQFFIGKGIAVMGPLALTSVCLLLVFCSKKVMYPWLISVFSLSLPIVLWLTNVFPA